jgi:hypothetical protein
MQLLSPELFGFGLFASIHHFFRALATCRTATLIGIKYTA